MGTVDDKVRCNVVKTKINNPQNHHQWVVCLSFPVRSGLILYPHNQFIEFTVKSGILRLVVSFDENIYVSILLVSSILMVFWTGTKDWLWKKSLAVIFSSLWTLRYGIALQGWKQVLDSAERMHCAATLLEVICWVSASHVHWSFRSRTQTYEWKTHFPFSTRHRGCSWLHQLQIYFLLRI